TRAVTARGAPRRQLGTAFEQTLARTVGGRGLRGTDVRVRARCGRRRIRPPQVGVFSGGHGYPRVHSPAMVASCGTLRSLSPLRCTDHSLYQHDAVPELVVARTLAHRFVFVMSGTKPSIQ